MFAALASNPALRGKLCVAVMLAPAVHMRYIASPALQVLAAMDADKVGAGLAALGCCRK